MDIWDWAGMAERVPVRGGDAAGITLELSRPYGRYSCTRTASEEEIQQYRHEYQSRDSARDKVERAEANWTAEAKLVELQTRAQIEYSAMVTRVLKNSRESGISPSMRPFRYGGWQELIDSIRATTEVAEDGTALVSLVFCHPQSVVFRDLKHGYTYLDGRSGTTWDLYFVGYSCVSPWKGIPPSKFGVPLWQFHPHRFDEIRTIIQDKHQIAVNGGTEMSMTSHGWRYFGNPELVSFMAYRDYIGVIDWLSLRAIKLVDANGNYVAQSLGEVVEVMSDWRQDDEGLRHLAPGEPVVTSVLPMGRALGAVGAALSAGVAGNAAYELIKLAVGL